MLLNYAKKTGFYLLVLIIIVESVQRGLRSGFYKQGQLILSRENGIQHFQKLVFSALTGSP